VSAQHPEVVIVGGGMVGASLACALADCCRVAVIESIPLSAARGEPRYQPSFDARSTALSLSSVAFFAQLGLWARMREHAAAIRRIHVSDRGRFGSTRMDAAEEGVEALGYVVENQWLGAVLHGALRENPAVTLFAPERAESLAAIAGGTEVRLAGAGTVLRCALAVIADGARSALAARLGIGAEQSDYGQSALIANIAHGEPHAGRAFERFTANGPLAMLPLPDATDARARSALVWVMAPQRAAAVRALEERVFLAELQQQFGYRLGRLRAVGERQVYPLVLSAATEQARAGIVLLGNAAHTLHPVAGQGFNLSLRDVAALAVRLRAARASGTPLGDPVMLAEHVAARAADQARTIGFSDALPRLFGSTLLPLAAARGLGLVGLELWGGARRQLVRHATGLAP
jgi:2-octaprenyl-6-methoxyphenol hydroxylase